MIYIYFIVRLINPICKNFLIIINITVNKIA